MRNKIYAILSILLFLSSCADNREKRKEIVKDKIVILNENLNEWNALTEEILNDKYVNSQLGKFINPSNLNKKLREKLIDKEISTISVQNNERCKEVEYITNWTNYPVGTLYLTWTNCDSTQIENGYYLDNFNTNFIEVWGAGNNWLIWIDSDFM